MPKGYPNPKTPPASEPAPMILIEPADDGAIRFNAYGLETAQMVDVLRRSLLHVVAMQSGMQVVRLDVPPAAAVVVPSRAVKKPSSPKPSRNGNFAREMKRELAEEAEDA